MTFLSSLNITRLKKTNPIFALLLLLLLKNNNNKTKLFLVNKHRMKFNYKQMLKVEVILKKRG